jgi:hypothetical protein
VTFDALALDAAELRRDAGGPLGAGISDRGIARRQIAVGGHRRRHAIRCRVGPPGYPSFGSRPTSGARDPINQSLKLQSD